MATNGRTRVAIARRGGGSHTAFTAGVLQGALANPPADVEVAALSGTSGGAICAALAWEALVRGEPRRAAQRLQKFWDSMGASDPGDQIANQSLMNLMAMRDLMVLPEVTPYQLPTWGMDRELTYRSKLDRRPEHLDELREFGRTKWRWFLKERDTRVEQSSHKGAA